jgi:hypothetical protein
MIYFIILIFVIVICINSVNSAPIPPVLMKYYDCKPSKHTKIFKQALKDNGFTISKHENEWNILFPCKMKLSYSNLVYGPSNTDLSYVSYIPQCFIIGSKYKLWQTILKYYGRKKASEIMPESFTFPQDHNLFMKQYVKDNYYVLKNDKQRQEGVVITNNMKDILEHKKNGYHTIQSFIRNPLTFYGYKINFRIYLVIVCNDDHMNAYMYDDGIVSYSKGSVDDNPNDSDSEIASFYTSKVLYDAGKFPITLTGYFKIAKNKDNVMPKIHNLMKQLMDATNKKLCRKPHDSQSFQLFGVDFIVTKDFDVYLLEVNCGPGMTPHNNEDKKMRYQMHVDLLKILNLIKNDKNDFTHFWSR